MGDIWQYIAISAVSIIIGSMPSYITGIKCRPTKKEVDIMIKEKSPIALKDDLKELKNSISDLKLEQTKIKANLDNLKNVKKSK